MKHKNGKTTAPVIRNRLPSSRDSTIETLLQTDQSAHIMSELLSHTAKGEEGAVRALLQETPEYLLGRGNIRDYSGRSFSNITAFQYALWALDSHMWKAMLSCIPNNTKGQDIGAGLLTQYEEVITNGLHYTDAKQEITHEFHFNFQPLINALSVYVEQFSNWDWTQRDRHWCTKVGVAQRNIPAHVAQEYCYPGRPFYPTPSFKEATLPRTIVFHNFLTGKDMLWWESESHGLKLGVNFAIYRWRGPRLTGKLGACAWRRGLSRTALCDKIAMTTLCGVRTAELAELKQLLQK